jgi:photosystem II stability/assembly factor-like uncharacterized protein
MAQPMMSRARLWVVGGQRRWMSVGLLVVALTAACSGSPSPPAAAPRSPAAGLSTAQADQAQPTAAQRPRWIRRGHARLIRRPPPRSWAAPAINDLYADGATVLAATGHGIERSTDDGRRWRTVMTGDRMSSITHGPTGYVGFGVVGGGERSVTATSDDGVHWQRVVSSRNDPDRLDLYGDTAVLDGSIGIAVPNASLNGLSYRLARTTDGGRHWRRVRGFREADGGVQLLPDGTLYITGSANRRQCNGVYRSTDIGATWTLLPGSCVRQPLLSLQFLDATHAIAVGGSAIKFNGGRVIETSSDSGSTWTTTDHVPMRSNFRRMKEGFARADFTSPTTGFVRGGICGNTEEGPCGGELYATTDAGRHLTRLPDPSPDGWSSIALTGADSLVAAGVSEGPDSVSGTSSDGGRGWRLEIRPRHLTTASFTRRRSTLFWRNSLGSFVSRDDGRSWTVTNRRVATVVRQDGQTAADRRLVVAIDQQDVLAVSRRRGPWHELRLDRAGDCQVAVAADDIWLNCSGSPSGTSFVAFSGDGGRRWRRESTGHSDLVDGRLVATGHGRAVICRGGALWRTRDGGATWRQSWPRLPGEGETGRA